LLLHGNNGKGKVPKFYVMRTLRSLLLTHFPYQERRTRLLRSPSSVTLVCVCVFLRL